jgi:signal transduction histidine kinase
LNDNTYALKNALLYTFLVGIILLAPLYVYTIYSKNIYEIQNELNLKKHANLIIQSMEEYNPKKTPYFKYPRFQRIESGLYDIHYKAIFTLIKEPFANMTRGYHIYNGYAYLILSLPSQRYFDANYLIIGNHLSYASVYQKVTMILLLIVLLIFALSIFFLNRFSTPFKQINKKLDNFIKDSMHEINTPLSIININIDLYSRKNKTNKYLQRIKAATKTLSTIYDDMDYLIKNNRVDFNTESIAMHNFLIERVSYFTEIAAMKDIELVCLKCDSVNIEFNTTQLQRIIDNSISNAIKYSHAQSKVEISLINNVKNYQLIFKDYGIGMKNPDKIFERYYRESSQVGGFGIGLNIVKSIIDQNYIDLHVSSIYKEGSTFTYTFPITSK